MEHVLKGIEWFAVAFAFAYLAHGAAEHAAGHLRLEEDVTTGLADAAAHAVD